MTGLCYNPFSLANKTVLVTGASSGIGRSIAIECSNMGAVVVMIGRNENRLRNTFELLQGSGHEILAIDINDLSSIEEAINKLPKLDGLVLAAGIVEMRPFMFATHDKMVSIFETNLFSPVQMLRLIVKKKKYNKGLSVVGISSVAGREDIVQGNGIYGSGKSAFSSILKYAALELAPKSIRVNTISPGMILTPMHTQGNVTQEQLDMYVSKLPLPRWGHPQEVAYSAVYLLSDASSYITGSDIKIDGGLTI